VTTRTSTELKRAFKRFVELVKPIEDVLYVLAADEDEPSFWTFITRLDDRVSSQVHYAEMEIMDQFPDLLLDFHVRYLEGRPLESFIRPISPLVYAREGTDASAAGRTD
jgi:hypothetical protein